MKRITSFLVLSLAFASASAQKLGDAAETDMVLRLKGLSAVCAIENFDLQHEARDNPSADKIETLLAKAAKCVETSLPQGRAMFQEAVTAAPESKQSLTTVYSRWLGYMGALKSYFDEAGQDQARQKLDEAVNDMQAEIDARTSTAAQ